MRKILLALVAVGAVATAVATPAEASGGCGLYRHRAPGGKCYLNGGYRYGYGPGVGYAPGVVVGVAPRYGWGWRHRYYRHY